MEIKKMCIVGAGMMGHQIAQLAAMNGHMVSMVDVDIKIVQKGMDTIKGNLSKFYVAKGKMTQAQADEVAGRITGTTNLKEAVRGIQMVIENIPEILELKQQKFKELDEICAPDVVLASNTSGMMITAVGTLTKRQDKVIGMHFFNPVTVMRLIEIVKGVKTSNETIQVIQDVSKKWGKETILVNDSPGFAVSRMFVVLINEAAKLVQEGVCSVEDADKGCQLGLGHAMGPLRTCDLTNGMGVSMHALDYMREILGDEYNPCLLIKKKFAAGELGDWAGKGFYEQPKK